MRQPPNAGDVVLADAAASVQFSGDRRLRLRVVAVDARPTYYGYAWITGYVIGPKGEATSKREVYVRVAGLQLLQAAPRPVRRTR